MEMFITVELDQVAFEGITSQTIPWFYEFPWKFSKFSNNWSKEYEHMILSFITNSYLKDCLQIAFQALWVQIPC